MASPPALELDEVSTAYDGVPMLRRVSLRVEEGELVCLLGSNGAGKTTTLRTLIGLVRPTEGRVRLHGRDLAGLGTDVIVRSGVGVVPEGRRLFPQLTVRENLALGLQGRPGRRSPAARIDEVLAVFPHLAGRLGQLAGTLSGGEQAMVAFGRALMGDPPLLLMDEPSLGLSPLMVEQYFAAIDRIHREGKTILLIEQNAAMALALADRGYVLEKGRVRAEGTASALKERDAVRQAYLRG